MGLYRLKGSNCRLRSSPETDNWCLVLVLGVGLRHRHRRIYYLTGTRVSNFKKGHRCTDVLLSTAQAHCAGER